MLTHTKIDYKNRTKEVICSASIVSSLTLVTLVLGNNLRNNYQKKKKIARPYKNTEDKKREKKEKIFHKSFQWSYLLVWFHLKHLKNGKR